MTTASVWVLVTYVSYSSGVLYSPPMQDLASCQRIQMAVGEAKNYSKCVQINMVVNK